MTQLTFHIWGMIPALTIPETVTYIGAIAFVDSSIGTLYYNATAEVKVEPMSNAPFRHAKIGNLISGENVHILPADMFAFANDYITTLDLQASAGSGATCQYDGCFYRTHITELCIGENVREIGINAFGDDDIAKLHFNAVNAVLGGGTGDTDYSNAPFKGATIADLSFGEEVTVIPDTLFAGADYTADRLAFPDSLTAIGRHAFHSTSISIGELTIGENITSIGKGAFMDCALNVLNYNAIEAELPGMNSN